MPGQRGEVHDRLATALRQAREEAKIGQREMAARMGTNQTAVSQIELGTQFVRVIDVVAWCGALKLDPAEFLVRVLRDKV